MPNRPAMTAMIRWYAAERFRWFHSGDLQGVNHLRNIIQVCLATPHVLHWLPTREGAVLQARKGEIPPTQIIRLLKLEERPANMQPWLDMLESLQHPKGEVRIGIVGKYVQLEDAYKSLREALLHGGLAHHHKTVIEWIESEEIDSLETAEKRLKGYRRILVPRGFGKRGIQGMIYTIEYAREHKVFYFGICLGMQCATVEYARDVSGLADADTTECNPQTPHRVIYKLRELLGVKMGGTMRLGAWPCKLEPGSLAFKAYGKAEISERHRHRYELNREYEKILTAAGLRITAAHQTTITWKLLRRQTIRGFWAASFTRSSSPSHWSRIRCLRHSLGRRLNRSFRNRGRPRPPVRLRRSLLRRLYAPPLTPPLSHAADHRHINPDDLQQRRVS